jgi:DNA-directed RNA polymerase specialized sigma24 family protein
VDHEDQLERRKVQLWHLLEVLGLSSEQRDILRRYYCEGHSMEDIATALDVHLATAYRRLGEVLKKLRDMSEDGEG